MGGSSSSSNQTSSNTTTANNSGTAAVSGDNMGAMISGINDSDINLSMTDHGAMNVASDIADNVLQLGQGMIEGNNNAIQNAFDFGESALASNTQVSGSAIDAMVNIAGQQSATTKAAIDMASAAKAREQTGENESNNEVLKNISLMVGILGTLITVLYLVKGKSK